MPIKSFDQQRHSIKECDLEHEIVTIRSSPKDYRSSIQATVKNLESICTRVH
jgi:hypothetical protein